MAAPGIKTDRCRSCGREIIWAKSPSGARLPLTAKPVTPYVLKGEPRDQAVDYRQTVTGGAGSDEKVYISHFVDCPRASEHSGRPRGG